MIIKAEVAGFIKIDDAKSEIKVMRGGLCVQRIETNRFDTVLVVKHDQQIAPGMPICIK